MPEILTWVIITLVQKCQLLIVLYDQEKETVPKGLMPLVDLLELSDNKELLKAATGAIWKCSANPKNAEVFEKANIIETLIKFINYEQPEEVRINCTGAIATLAKRKHNRPEIRQKDGIKSLMSQLGTTTVSLLVNSTDAVGTMAEDKESIGTIIELDGIRLLWSLLKNPNWEVQASAANAMCPCLRNMEDAGEEVRAYVGGLEIMMNLLKSDHDEVLAAMCKTVAQIAQDQENLGIMTDLKVVELLANLTGTNNDLLKVPLCDAIGYCSNKKQNCREFGDYGAVLPILNFLKTSNKESIKASAAFALNKLSEDARNCITMHKNGVFEFLMETIASKNTELQKNSASCLANIRRLAMCNERAKYGR